MSRCVWIRGGQVIDPASNRDEVGDVFLRDGQVAKTLSPAEKEGAEVVDASGLIVCPGLVDIHVHFREPGQTHKENTATGTRAAAAGGFTTVVCMPNTNPPCDQAATIKLIQSVIERDAVVRVYPTGCITMGREGEQLAPAGSLKAAGVVALTDDGDCVQDNEVMRRALEYANMHGLPVMDHCQDARLTRGSVMNEGVWSARLGLTGWPNAAEDVIVSRNVILSEYTGAHVHMQHISSANAVDILRRAKTRGVRVTSEATPHHVALTEEMIAGYNTNAKMNPPLRTEADREAIVQGLLDGTLDCLATDHAPHTKYEKDVEFDQAPFGILGLETALSVTWESLVRTGRMTPAELLAAWTVKPAAILGLKAGTLAEGAPGDVCLFDPEGSWTVSRDTLQSRSVNTPWMGQTLAGRVVTTLVGGRIVYCEGEVRV